MILRTLTTCILLLSGAYGDHFLGDELQSDVTVSRVKRDLPEWQVKLREKAESFGQSDKQQETVQYYLGKLNDIAESRHQDKSVNEVRTQLDLWNNRQHDDVGSKKLKPEESRHHFQGDIVLTPDQAEELYERAKEHGNRRVKRKFIGTKVRRWDPTKPIVYSFDGSHTKKEQRVIELALEHWHNITCLNFERHEGEPKGSQLVFTDVDGCASNVGRHPLGEPQFVSLGPECIRLGVIAHEVAHALGFWHEQSRPDRDFFVNVRWENIDKDSKGQFLKEQPVDVDTGGVPYDYGSIMHYRSKAFARFDDLFTLSTFVSDYQRTIGQRDQLSFNDIRLMNTIYCKNTCSKKLPCQRGGYTDPRHCDKCRCPDGFTGTLCDEVMPGYGAECGGNIRVKENWLQFSSPSYPAEFKEGQECSWMFTAPKGQHVLLQFNGEFEMYCKIRHSLCMDYVEVKNTTDFANTGMRYCCNGTPKSPVVSATEDLVVLFRSFYRSGKGFQARVKAVPHTGSWSTWSSWSECTASCGACGARRRTRECTPANAFCLGEDVETEVCNTSPCKGLCSRKRVEEAPCTGFLSLLKGIKCKTEKTRMEECNEICCSGFQLIDGECKN
ncbi:unnamed protein product [Bursaphelenchus okinawaensis]|uniref:Zinc metalloproteinase n=1 Tax=Bursaphelenchus okinawaensis TaxID=465554 RepID=A0A811KQI7_9BILA|nr:unnamed protein product [Bursaphelenchus okinawaensis]CAG9108030.1 unnamed protein product [Bursaphelenchus okinawaensis]